jgi:hypothetical protein
MNNVSINACVQYRHRFNYGVVFKSEQRLVVCLRSNVIDKNHTVKYISNDL